jgi:hypothetical protein
VYIAVPLDVMLDKEDLKYVQEKMSQTKTHINQL